MFNKKAILVIIIIVLFLFSTSFLVYVNWLSQTNPSHFTKGYDAGIKKAQLEGNYIAVNMTKELDADHSLTINNVYLGIKRIIVSYTIKSKNGNIPFDYNNELTASRCKIAIDSEHYDVVEETLSTVVKDKYELKSALLLDASNYGTDFDLAENPRFNIMFDNLMNTNKNIDFDFQMNKPEFLKQELDFNFKHNNKNYTIQSIELDSTTTTLNFSQSIYITDIRLEQNSESYEALTISNKGQHYISFPVVQKEAPFTIYIHNKPIYTHYFS